MIEKEKLRLAKEDYLKFIDSMMIEVNEYSFTLGADSSPYALCFAIFGYNLLNRKKFINNNKRLLSNTLVQNLRQKKIQRINDGVLLKTDKQYLQLFCFTLSCLDILGEIHEYDLKEDTLELIPDKIENALQTNGVFECRGGSGNYAMFIGILLLFARDYLKLPFDDLVEEWLALNLNYMNNNYLWGKFNSLSHHQFQNGYHQYEIFEYTNYDYPRKLLVKMNELQLAADKKGHFAPWPGGASCHDYDAYFLLTLKSKFNNADLKLFELISLNILNNQNSDGGFCESHYIRPRTIKNLLKFTNHVFAPNILMFKERLYQFLTLQRVKHDRISSYVSNKSRKWSESNLWDSWFRMMTIARLECSVFPDKINEWGFINFPGIGYFRKK